MKLRVAKHENPHDDYHIIDCLYDRKVGWTPGVYGEFSLPQKKIEGSCKRIFSIASIEEENRIKFATRIQEGGSDFKKHLAQVKEGVLKPGMKVNVGEKQLAVKRMETYGRELNEAKVGENVGLSFENAGPEDLEALKALKGNELNAE